MSATEISGEEKSPRRASDRLLESAYRKYFSALFGFLKSRRYDDATAQDLTQTAFLKLAEYKKRDEIRDMEAFLFRTVLNLSSDHRRKEASIQRTVLDFGANQTVNPVQILTPEENAMLRERLARLEKAIAELPPRSREALSLCLFSNRSRSDIAAQLGMTEAALAMLFMRAMRHCREAIDALARKDEADAGLAAQSPTSYGANGKQPR